MGGPGGGPKLNVMSKDLFFSLYFPAIALSLGQGIATPVLPVYVQQYGVSFEQAALVVILHSIGSLVATIPIGYAMDRWGRRPILLAGPILTAMTSFLIAFASPTFGLLLAWRFLGGSAQQMWQLSRLAMITDTGKDRERGRLITWMMQVGQFSGLFSPALGGFIATYWDIRVPFVFHGVLVLLAIIPSFRTAKETIPTGRAGTGGRAFERAPWRVVFRDMRHPQMIAFLTAQFMANFTRGVNRGGLLNLYAAYKYGVGPQEIGLLASANSFLQLPLGFTTGYIMDRWGRKKTIVPGFSLLFVAMLFMTSTAFFDMPFNMYVAAYLCVTFAQGITGGNMQVMGSDLAPSRGRGQWMSVWRFIAESGNQLSPTVFAAVSFLFGYVGSFSVVGFSALSVALLVGLCIRETVGRSRESEPPADSHGSREPVAAAAQPSEAPPPTSVPR
jgi:MFS family permease